MRCQVLWRSASRCGSHGTLVTGLRKLLSVNPFCDEGGRWRSQCHHLQPTRRWSSKMSARDNLLHPFSIQQSGYASTSYADTDVLPANEGDGLVHVLRCEVEDLTKRSLNITPRRPPKPFTLVKDEPGEMEITLTRIYGLEDITMDCVLQLVRKEYQRKSEVGEDPESRTKMLQLTISITKGGPFPILKLRCECYRDGFAIHQVDLEGEDEKQTVYRPYFSESAEGLVNNFQMFLHERGLNADLSGYIEKHLERKRLMKSAAETGKIIRFLSSPPEV